MTMNPIEHVLEYMNVDIFLDKIYNNRITLTKEELKNELQQCLVDHEHVTKQISETFLPLMIDTEGSILYIDERFCNQLGYQKKELINHHFRILHADVHGEDFYTRLWSTVQANRSWSGDICIVAKTGEMFWFRTNIIPIKLGDAAFVSMLVCHTDISDLKHDDKRLIETIDDDYRKVFSQLRNLTFRVQRNQGARDYHFRLFKGNLADKIANTLDDKLNIEMMLDELMKQEYHQYFLQAFNGEEVMFKHRYQGFYLYTTLSPIYENHEVIELIGSSIDITLLEKAEAKVNQLAYYDSLTNLPNRSKFRKDLQQAVRHGDHYPFAVLYCDIDRLKYINDTLGELIGDEVITIIAKRLDHLIQGLGTLYRYGGDEFSLIVHGSWQEIKRISDQMLSEIKRSITIQGHEFFVTSSIGISYYGEDAMTVEELINHASIAVHYCKVNGRNSRLFFAPKMNEMYNDILLLEGDIRKALQRNEFELFYQPKITVDTGKVIGLEALIRWTHPLKGPIPPSTFIPLAEESGLITQIGEWVIRQACYQHMDWVNQGYLPIRVAVNVSAIELQRFDFANQVAQIIDETKMDPTFLEIEITENSVMQNTEDCINTMKTLREMGISLSIDDFGTGYSSFGYLKKFPIHYLKIDQSFIRSALIEPSSAEIVKAMIQLGHTFGLEVVAEGVEEEDILALLQEQDCDYYQGYYFSRPLPAKELTPILCEKMG